MDEQAVKELQAKYNVLTLAGVNKYDSGRINEFLSIDSTVVEADFLEYYEVGDRYDESARAKIKLYSPSANVLLRISSAAGIEWDNDLTGSINRTRDYVCFRAAGRARWIDGTMKPISQTYDIDAVLEEEDLTAKNLVKAHKYNSADKTRSYLDGMTPELWAQLKTKSALIQFKRTMLRKAETGAMARVIRKVVNLRQQMTIQECKKPFLVYRVLFTPDYKDPAIRAALISSSLGIRGQLSAPWVESPMAALPAPRADDDGIINSEYTYQDSNMPDETQDDIPPVDDWPSEETIRNTQEQRGVCSQCVKSITPGVSKYSLENYGRELCQPCQDNVKAGERR